LEDGRIKVNAKVSFIMLITVLHLFN